MALAQYTRGVGVYPGDPRQDFSPVTGAGPAAHRNLALLRPAFHSSSYDFNLTAQLVTDGIRVTTEPRRIVVSTSAKGVLPKGSREDVLDGNWVTTTELSGKTGWIQVEVRGGEAPTIDSIAVDGAVQAKQPDNQQWTVTVLVSTNGADWRQIGQATGCAHPTGEIHPVIPFEAPSKSRFYRVQFDNGRPLTWRIGEVRFLNGKSVVQLGGPFHFTSAWMSAGAEREWIYVDLGAKSSIDRVSLAWIARPTAGAVEISNDARTWKRVRAIDADDMPITPAVEARYVRLALERAATPAGYILSEFEVYGTGGVSVAPHAPAAGLELAGGAWKLQRDSQVNANGEALSRAGFNDSAWLPATVPGTVLTSYLNAGAVPDPNYGDNQLQISDSFFHADFWYRNEFAAPEAKPGERIWLNFDGINWKAEVFLNGARLGVIEGGFLRGRFDVTGKLRQGRKNALAVRVLKMASPGSIKQKTYENVGVNGGVLGADNPTYHASIGWDWIPTIRGRNTGIWNRVHFTRTGEVTLADPGVVTKSIAADGASAEVAVEVLAANHGAAPVNGVVRGKFGAQTFTMPVALAAGEEKAIAATIKVDRPKLWWPNGYGEPNLYDVELAYEPSDVVRFQAGVRQFRYSEDGGILRFWINGRRFIPRGGNWGFPESMLRYRAREYDATMRYHRHLNFNMVRNWVGQIGENEFYEAADRHGIVIMQDFWLANPWDGPDPDDNAMFVRNARDMVRRVRHHASIGLYCGRNEGYPLKPLDDQLRDIVAKLHAGIHYVPSSADDVVTGHGPYRAMPVKYYFQQRTQSKFHSEIGMPNIVTMDSLRAMMPEEGMWPQGAMWGLHDYCLTGAQGGASFREAIDQHYGGAKDAAEWVQLAQFLNYDGYRAMLESQSKNRGGVLLWMSHPAWPSMVWQTYDFYLDPTAGYFGARKGSEPLHIQWNPATDKVEVVNYSAGHVDGLTAHVEILDLHGKRVWEKSATLAINEDSVASPIAMHYPAGLTPVHFLRLKLTRGATVVSENFYHRGVEENRFRALRTLPHVAVAAKTRSARNGDAWTLTTELTNTGTAPALMVRVKAIREKTRDRILPAIYSDNYVALMPGEHRVIHTEVREADTRGEAPAIAVEGFNVN